MVAVGISSKLHSFIFKHISQATSSVDLLEAFLASTKILNDEMMLKTGKSILMKSETLFYT